MSFLIASPCLQVKTAWLVDLENLVDRISNKFSAHFASMGFAGQVSVYQEMMTQILLGFDISDKSSLNTIDDIFSNH